MTVQPLRGGLERTAREGVLQHFEHAVALFAKCVEAGTDDAKVFGADDSAEPG